MADLSFDTALDQLRPGQAGHVVLIEQAHPLRRRLLELGFIRGARVEVVRQAPMGDPLQLRVGRTDLALRRADLSGIWVRAEDIRTEDTQPKDTVSA